MATARNDPADRAPLAREWPWARATGVAGVTYVILTVAGFVVGGQDATPRDSADVVRGYFADNRSGVLTGVYIDTLAMVCLLAFAAGLGGLVARRGGDPWGVLGRLMLAGALGSFAITMAENMAEAALAFRVASAGDPGAVEALFGIVMMVNLTAAPLAAFLVGAAAGILRSGIAPRWLGWAALAPALLGVIGAAGLSDPRGPVAAIGFAGGYLPFLLWTLVTSVVLLVRREAPASVTGERRAYPGGERLQTEP